MAKQPNVIYILADDMGYGDVSALNENSAFQTPHFDALCEGGMAFTDAHATSAVCSPSRYSILTGRYNWRSWLKKMVLSGYATPLVEEGRLTVAEMFRQNGYRTAAVGKWHLGMDFAKTPEFVEAEEYEASPGVDYGGKIENGPTTRGFDYYYGISASLDMPPYIYIENDRFTMLPDHETEDTGKRYWRLGPTAPDFRHEEVLDHLADKSLELIEKYKDEPFFLYFPLPAPHTPILPSKEFQGKSGTNEYGDFVLHCDDVVGRITAKLRELGLEENTLVIFTSDNGCSPTADFEELGAAGHNPNYVFRGHKADIYEGGHRVPLLMKWPAVIPAGKRCDQVVCLCDFMATMADYLGVSLPDNAAEDSVSNLPLWKGGIDKPVREHIVHQSIDGSLSIREGSMKLELCPGSGGWSYPAPGEETADMPRFQLYDLNADIGERRNLIEEQPEMSRRLRWVLKGYVFAGRSTPGAPQQNNGEPIWDTIKWIEEV